MSHMIVSSIIHGVIYDVVWKAMRGLGLPASIAVAVTVVAVVWLGGRLLRRR